MAARQEDGDGTEEIREEAPPALSSAIKISIVGTFAILLFGALYLGRALVLPIILGMLLFLTFMPVVRSLSRRGIPSAVSAILLVAAFAGISLGASILLADPVTQVIEDAPRTIRAVKERFSYSGGTVSALIEAKEQVEEITDGDTPPSEKPQKVVIAQPGILSWAADTLSGIGSTLVATFILAAFLLSSGDMFLQKLVRVLPTLRDKKRSVRVVHDIEFEVSRYLLTITVINICFGAIIGLAMAALGMPNPIMWGIAAALLNYVPYLGALVAIALAGATAIVTYPTLTMAALPPLAYLVINLAEGTVITPLILGRRLELNAVVILIALAVCGWLWGVVGVLIAVPLLVVVKVICDHSPSLAGFGEFLSGNPPLVEAAASSSEASEPDPAKVSPEVEKPG